MNRLVNLLFAAVIVIYFFNIYAYYLSDKNIKNVNSSRSNIDEILKNKISNLPILESDTNNVIEFNSSFSDEIKNNKPRSFWNLLKSR
jgi:hypothetical protein|tara:strand:- start:464 stop:727 length:264 start_codon:yes stop_codon:yes gene_type:complete